MLSSSSSKEEWGPYRPTTQLSFLALYCLPLRAVLDLRAAARAHTLVMPSEAVPNLLEAGVERLETGSECAVGAGFIDHDLADDPLIAVTLAPLDQ